MQFVNFSSYGLNKNKNGLNLVSYVWYVQLKWSRTHLLVNTPLGSPLVRLVQLEVKNTLLNTMENQWSIEEMVYS